MSKLLDSLIDLAITPSLNYFERHFGRVVQDRLIRGGCQWYSYQTVVSYIHHMLTVRGVLAYIRTYGNSVHIKTHYINS